MSEAPVFRLADSSSSFATRGKGRDMFGSFQGVLNGQLAEHPGVIVDWSGVNAASPGFIDEFIGLVCPEGESSSLWHGVIFTGSNLHITGRIDMILRRRGCQLKYAPTPEAAEAGDLSVLGGVVAKGPNPV